jgi:hypothetical protein
MQRGRRHPRRIGNSRFSQKTRQFDHVTDLTSICRGPRPADTPRGTSRRRSVVRNRALEASALTLCSGSLTASHLKRCARRPTTPTRFRDTGRDLTPCPQQGDMSNPRGDTRTKHSPAQSDRSMSSSSISSLKIGSSTPGLITLPVSCSNVSMSDWSW